MVSCKSINYPYLQLYTDHPISRVWDTATGQCLRTLVHEDNAPVTTVRFSPNGRYILAFTLDSCIRLWDYVSGTCKKTYQGHINKKYSLGGAFGVGGTEGLIVSGSEDGEIIFWDVRTKEVVQRVNGHDGVVCWVDTFPPSGTIVSGGLDGTVRIWVDVQDDQVDTLHVKREPAFDQEDLDLEMGGVKIDSDEPDYGDDVLGGGSADGRQISEPADGDPHPDKMEED
jgi:COMPASS component SWD3